MNRKGTDMTMRVSSRFTASSRKNSSFMRDMKQESGSKQVYLSTLSVFTTTKSSFQHGYPSPVMYEKAYRSSVSLSENERC
jgi:hypothetical protein